MPSFKSAPDSQLCQVRDIQRTCKERHALLLKSALWKESAFEWTKQIGSATQKVIYSALF